MIEVNYSGGLGVRLFQYMFARILSELRDDTMYYEESESYKKDYENTKNRKYYSVSSLKEVFPNIDFNIKKNNNYLDNPLVISGHIHDINKIVNHKGKIIMKGSGFQRYEYYKNYKDLIKKVLYIPNEMKHKFDENDVVIHYRLGDTKTEGIKYKVRHNEKYLGFHNCQNMTPDYIIDILSNNNFSNIYLVTDEPNAKEIEILKNRFNIKLVSKSMYQDFILLTSAPNLIIGHSTFSWWAALLSDAKKIYMAKTNYNENIKYHAEWIYRDDINLNVDENRYIYV